MESGKFLQNPRFSPSVPFSANNNNKAMPSELVQKQPLTAVDKFRSYLKQREEETRVSSGGDDEDDVAPLSMEDIVELYEMVLAELTFNSKPIINDLTMIAGDQRAYGEGIADAICARIVEVPVEQKLPSLYLLDSIVKNIGKDYVRHFSARLPEVFCEAYRQVNPNLHPSMRHLFGTWSTVFPPSVLRKIETELQFSPQANKQSSGISSLRASESPRPSHGIHVNPKYIRQLEHSTADSDIQHVRGTSSNLKIYGQKPAIGYDEFDSDHAEATSSQVGAQRLNSSGAVGHASFALGANKLHSSSTSRLARPLSPSRNGSDRISSSQVDEFAENSPRRLEGASPSHSVLDYGLGRAISRDEEMRNEWRRKHYSDDNHNRFEISSYNLRSGQEHERPRALIDAYGNDRGRTISNNKPLQVECMNLNGMNSKAAPRSWQTTEEEEFDWEDMSPTLADHGRRNDFIPSSVPPFGSIGARPDFRKMNGARMESDLRGNQSSPAQLPLVDDSSLIAEGAISSMGSGRGLIGKVPGFQPEPNQNLGSHYPQEAWQPHHFSQSSHPLNARGRGRDFQMPFSASAVSSLGDEKMVPQIDKLPDADAQFVRPSEVMSRMGAPGLDPISVGTWPAITPSSTGVRPPINMHKSHPPPMHHVFSVQKQPRSQFDLINGTSNVTNQSSNKLYSESMDISLMKPAQLHDQRATLNQRNHLQQQYLPNHEARNSLHPSISTPVPSHLMAPPFNHGYMPRGHNAVMSMVPSNPVHAAQLPLPMHNIPNSYLPLQGGALPPLPPGPRPAASQIMPVGIHGQPPGSAFSGLISSLMSQGLISLEKQTAEQDSVGLDFNADILKVRHESAISALYGDLPRQCTTCGLRFKCQEAHRSHMDWHVTRNRMSKNRKQKPSRKWFVSASMWLSGAEALGTDAAPGFLPTETIVEQKDDEKMAVPADDDQTACALCGEAFDTFYSDETEEWMYRGAVYMNTPDGSTAGMDRSQLGPIVHAKCRSDSTVPSHEDFRHDEGGNTEEGSRRKRLRS